MQVETRGLKVYYEQAGSGEPLILLHGWGSSSEVFKPLLMRIAQSRTVRAIDFPGFGNSQKPQNDWSTQSYADHLASLLDEWGVKSTDVIAHSFGARVALRLAASRPEMIKKLALTGAAGIRKERAKIPLSKRVLGSLAKLAGNFGSIGGVVKEKIYSKIGSADYLSAGEMRSIFVRVVNEDILEILPKISHETLLIWGDADRETPLEAGRKMNESIKNSKLEIIEGAGHYAFNDRPDKFYDIIRNFFGLPK